MGLDRRTFLQRAGLALLTFGLSETGGVTIPVPLLNRYSQALAAPNSRKLALLVGVNQYPRTTALTGCVTDVELQRDLLIHRFGFNPRDILTLTEQQATREDIETAFVEHLIEQAQEGDIVVFHFSGYGSQVKLANPKTPSSRLVKSLVPVDGTIPTKGEPAVNEILETTLVLLARSLKTKNVTMVLDTSYLGIGQTLQGNLRIRSCPNPPAEKPSPEELAFQERLLLRTQPSLPGLKGESSLEQVAGIVFAATGDSQVATESKWSGFSAGLFTYALTQHLWEATPANTIYVSLARTAQTVERLTGQQQQPQVTGSRGRTSPLLTYFLQPKSPFGADGFVTSVEDNGKTAQLRLVGLPVTVLEYYGVNSRLTVTTPSEEPGKTEETKKVQLQIRSRDGLTAKAKLVEETASEEFSLQPGQLVRESIRVIKRNPALTVALDNNLQRIERVDATSAFANIGSVSAVVSAGEQAADCLFGTIEDPASLEIAKNAEGYGNISSGSYGLFSVGRVLIPNTAGAKNEAVKSAITRLVPKLKTLLAAKLWRLTLNEGSSRLGIEATLEVVDVKTEKLIQRDTLRTLANESQTSQPKPSSPENFLSLSAATEKLSSVAVGSRIQYRLRNYSDRDLYIMLVGIDSGGNAIALYSPEVMSEADTSSPAQLKNTAISAGESLVFPRPSASFNFIVPGPVGLAEIYIIASHRPFTQTLKILSKTPHSKGEGERIVDLSNPLEVAQALLQDLHAASGVNLETIGSASDVYALNTDAWATLSFIYKVV